MPKRLSQSHPGYTLIQSGCTVCFHPCARSTQIRYIVTRFFQNMLYILNTVPQGFCFPNWVFSGDEFLGLWPLQCAFGLFRSHKKFGYRLLHTLFHGWLVGYCDFSRVTPQAQKPSLLGYPINTLGCEVKYSRLGADLRSAGRPLNLVGWLAIFSIAYNTGI